MATVAAGCLNQPGLVERRDLDQLYQLDPLHQQLGDTVTTLHGNRGHRVEVDQRNLELATIASVDCARTVDDRQSHPGGQSRAWMDQANHAERDGDRDPRPHQGSMPRREADVFCTVEINPGVAVVSAAGQGKLWVDTDNGQTGRHGATDYP